MRILASLMYLSGALLMAMLAYVAPIQMAHAQAQTEGVMSEAVCQDARIFEKVFNQVCWDCFLDDLSLFGVGNKPDGAAQTAPACMCVDDLGVPEFGYPLSMWTPQKLNEVTTIPWCSPSLGGIRLQDTLQGLGYQTTGSGSGMTETKASAFYQYHYFTYPLMAMLEMLILPSCYDGFQDFDLMYISEIDPTWNNDLLALVLNPEAIIFSNPIALAYCSADCVAVTAGTAIESSFPCAGCDGNLYPFTGHVYPQPDPVAASSLISQRVLASLHRRGLARRSIGNEAMCEPEFYPMLPRSQYKFSMLYPIPEASSDLSKNIIAGASDFGDMAGQAGASNEFFESCCHPMGMSTSRWCLPVGGRLRPGMDKSFVYMIWQYRDCCVRSTGG